MSLGEAITATWLVAGFGLLTYLWHRGRKSNVKNTVKEVLFFPDTEFPCEAVTRSYLASCHNPSCKRLHGFPKEVQSSLIKFISYIRTAARKLDICIYMLTQPILVNVIIELLESRRIAVRIITDSKEYQAAGTQIRRLLDVGAEIKANRIGSGALMHHKFVIVDDTILMTGSFNWTSSAVVKNFEAIIVTDDEDLVLPFKEKFLDLWNDFPHYLGGDSSEARFYYNG